MMTLRAATVQDVPGILAIYNDAVLHSTATADYEPQALKQRIAWYEDRVARGCPVFVAVDAQGEVAGWSSYAPYHNRIGYRYTVENSVYVAADQRGKGIGKLLLASLVETARQQQVHTIIACIDGENEISQRLHASFGFVPVGRFKEVIIKFDRWLDVVYMQLLLNPSGSMANV